MGQWLIALEPGGRGDFDDAMRTIALSRQGKGVMVILSDFLLKEGYERGLRYLAGGGYDTFCLQVLSPEEIDPGKHGLAGDLRLTDVEDDDTAEVTVSAALLKTLQEEPRHLLRQAAGVLRPAGDHPHHRRHRDRHGAAAARLPSQAGAAQVNFLTWTTGAILAAALIPPLIILYFLKLRRRNHAIASTLLWKRAVEDLHANAPFQKLRKNLLLLLQLLAIILLALSVMQPQLQSSGRKGGRYVLLIDNSASMTATDTEDGASRLEVAKLRAKERIESIYSGGLLGSEPGETMIIAFSDRAEIACRFSTSRQELLDAIDRILPTHAPTSIGEAFKLARAYTTNTVVGGEPRPIGELPALEIFSDGRITDINDQALRVQQGEQLTYHRIGSDASDNVTITSISIERPYDRPTFVEVFCSLLNYNQSAVTCELQLSVDDRALAVEEVPLPAATINASTGELVPGRNNLVFSPFEQPRGAVIGVRNLRQDDLDVDNIARLVVPPPKRLNVGLVAPKSFILRTALEGLPLESIEILSARQYERRAEAGELERYDVIVFDNYAPPEGLMPTGRYLTLGATPPVEGFNEFGTSDEQIVLNQNEEHPALQFVSLDRLVIRQARLIQPADDLAVLVEGSKGPVVLALSRGALHIVHVAFDPLQSDWPFRRSFITFLFNAVDYLGQIGEGVADEDRGIGDALVTRLPATSEDITLTLPDDSTLSLRPVDPTNLSWGPIRLAGLYVMAWKQDGAEASVVRPFAVNMLDEHEGRLDSIATITVGSEERSGVIGEADSYVPLWPYAIGLTLALLMFEWWIYHRRSYI
jgi:hypothetical protein